MSQTNPDFADFRPNYWELYEKCRFNGLAAREQAAQAAKLEKRVRFALMISIVGSASCGAVQTLTGLETAPVWELLSMVATALAVWAFFVNSSEKSYEAFLAALRFEDLAHEVDLATLDALHSGG